MLLVHRDGRDRLVRVLEEVAVALLALPRGLLGARALDRDPGQMRRELDEVDVAFPAPWGSRLYSANVPSNAPSVAKMGVDQHARRPALSASSR